MKGKEKEGEQQEVVPVSTYVRRRISFDSVSHYPMNLSNRHSKNKLTVSASATKKGVAPPQKQKSVKMNIPKEFQFKFFFF